MRLPGFQLLPLAVAQEEPPKVGGEDDLTAAAILGCSFHDSLPGDNAAGAADGQEQTASAELEILPLEGAQLPPAAAGAHGEQIEHPVVPRLLCQSIQQFHNLYGRGNVLSGAVCHRQVDHPSRILLDDLIPLGIAENSGDHGQVLLHRGLPDGLATVFPLPQFYQHILQSNRTEPVDGDGPDEGVRPPQHPPVALQGAGSIPDLPGQPPLCELLEGHIPVLAVSRLELPFQFLRLVSHILPDTSFGDALRHSNGLGFADLLPVGAVAVADGDLESAVVQLFNACHAFSILS